MSTNTNQFESPGVGVAAEMDTLQVAVSTAASPRIHPVLDRERFEEHLREFTAEHRPCGPTEHALVRDLARQAAAVDRWGAAAEAVERTAACKLPGLATFPDGDDFANDALLAGAMATDAAHQCERHSLARSRAFCRTLAKLEQLQAKRNSREVMVMQSPFADEVECEEYLSARLRRDSYRCGRCGGTTGSYLPSRQMWECGKCRKQFGLRSGTVMAGSALSLFTWSEAIRLVLWRPTIGAAELAEKIGLKRIATVRSMMVKIRTALAAEDASERLAGLDRHFASN
jgi:hypothetical protein